MNRDYVVKYTKHWCGRLGIDVPPIRITNLNTMGSIAYHKDEPDNRCPFISINKPLLDWWMRDELEDTIRHELIHIASDDYEHGVEFKKYARRYNVKIRVEDT
jgi:hypothetical protein